MQLEQIKQMSDEQCAVFTGLGRRQYGDIDVAWQEVIRKCNENGIFVPVIDDETHSLLAMLSDVAQDLGIGIKWQNMLSARSMKSLSVAADSANSAAVRADYCSAEQAQAARIYNAARLAYWASWPRSVLAEQRYKATLRTLVSACTQKGRNQ